MTENILSHTHAAGNLEEELVEDGSDNVYEKQKALFWVSVVAYLCISVLAVAGNGLVIYAAYGNKNTGPLRYLDDTVKSLAVADMLFGFIGTPLIIVNAYWCKN